MRWLIDVRIYSDEIRVLVKRNGEFYDYAEFHPSEQGELITYLCNLAREILDAKPQG